MANGTSNGNNISNIIFEMTTSFINNLNAAVANFISKLETVAKDSDEFTEKQLKTLELNLKESLSRLERQYESLNRKVNTPPRNEELDEGHKNILKQFDNICNKMDEVKNASFIDLTSIETKLDKLEKTLNNTGLFMKIFIGFIGVAIVVGSIITYYGNARDKTITKLEKRIEYLDKSNQDTTALILKRLELLENKLNKKEKDKNYDKK